MYLLPQNHRIIIQRTFSIDRSRKRKKASLNQKKLFKPNSKTSTEEFTESNGETVATNEESQKMLEMHFNKADCLKSEIIWTLKSVLGGFSVRAHDGVNEILSGMCPDNKIARNVSMARTKAMYAINHGTAPYFKSLLLSSINTPGINSFDESLHEVTQTCEMDLYAFK